MKVAVAVVLVFLSLAGLASGQAAKEACTDTCNNGLTCVDKKCLYKVGGTCTDNDQCTLQTTCKAGTGGSKTCECVDGAVAKADKTWCLLKVDQTCTKVGAKATQCAVGSTCKEGTNSAKTCTCDANTVVKDDKTQCLMKVEETCAVDADCVKNGKCSTAKKCACDTNFKASDDNSACKAALQATCNDNADCGINAQCNGNKKCECKTDFDPVDGRCGKKVDKTCGGPTECVMGADCTKSKCQCKDGYSLVSASKTCKKNGAQTVMVSLVLLFAAFVATRLH